ncbi:Uncharacterized membrane protein [Thermosyntropha lipolytica DSM 11003]|uniref:Uncharacterized membrane protein n=1 Tax=Thermosyntropha lipolytica DSM 11003 TaxID=1123382 RepID=A0A1M5NMM9_9FIRM|nr:DUF1614 domain-containing protein [Thermosyntropha lipolytica]SHG90806.1 Uncharacterized membrane protein [Thermosyntropha lipolytica DSM 11003]
MTNFPLGLIILVAVSILIYFGAAHRVLDRMRLSDKGALAVIAAIIIGSFFDIPVISRITVNLGGIIAVILAVYVWLGAGTAYEKIRAVIAAVVTALALFLAARFLGAEPEQIFIDPIYIYPIVAGVVGYLAGRSRRGAFFAAVMGVLALDIGQYVYLVTNNIRGKVVIGGAGAFDSLILAGILAVLLAEIIGETLERVQGGPDTDDRPSELIKNLREPEPARKPLNEGEAYEGGEDKDEK